MKQVYNNVEGRCSAGLTFVELDQLANAIRTLILNNTSMTLNDYIKRAKDITVKQLGYRYVMALKNEKMLQAYFPDEVYAILKEKHKKQFGYNEIDDEFIRNNKEKGLTWLAKMFYTTHKSVRDRAKYIGVKIAKETWKFFNEKEDLFIKEHKENDISWLAIQLSRSEDSIRNRLDFFNKKKKDVHESV